MGLMKVSIATACMNRLAYVRNILPKNIEDNPNAEFVLMDYGSTDGLEGWIRAEMWHHVEAGRLVVYRIDNPPFFVHAHAKNMAHVRASGDIVCNLDAETVAGKGFADSVAEAFVGKLDTHIGRSPNGGGRIALSKANFLKFGGYDEDMIYGWGHEDNDFYDRIANVLKDLPLINDAHVYVFHKNGERTVHTRMKDHSQSFRLHKALSQKNIDSGKFIANQGREIGYWPTVIKNYTPS